MEKYVFTFGSNHCDIEGNSLLDNYVVIEGDYSSSRYKMNDARKNNWAFQYSWEEFVPQIAKFSLSEVPLDQVAITKMIRKFQGNYDFLSNFYGAEVRVDNIIYNNAESAYQAQKCLDRRAEFIGLSGTQAKKLGKLVPMDESFEFNKINLMETIVRCKFEQNPYLTERLIATGGAELIEGNHWKDTFWGIYNGEGSNHLGKILMKVRDELNEEL